MAPILNAYLSKPVNEGKKNLDLYVKVYFGNISAFS
jgi:hypothetical protein